MNRHAVKKNYNHKKNKHRSFTLQFHLKMELDLESELLGFLGDNDESQNIIKRLIKQGVDVNTRNRYGQTALFFSFSNTTKILINAGAHVDIKDNTGKTPLFLSDSEKSKILIENLSLIHI